MALHVVTLHFALPRLPPPCIAYQIHCFANTASACELRSTCIVPWLSPLCSMALKHGPPPSYRPRLDVFDMRCQRRLLRVFWQQHISNQSIRERTKQPTASSLLRQRRAYAGLDISTACHPPSLFEEYDFAPNIHGWKRPRGRPKTRWADSIKHDLNSAGLDTTNAALMVFDRPQWKAFVSGLPTLEPEQGS